RLDPEERMIRDVQAEHLLLEAQAIALVELVDRHTDALVEAAAVVPADVAEQAHHALITFAPAHQSGVDDLLEDHQQSAARMAERIECAGLDERLDGALV